MKGFCRDAEYAYSEKMVDRILESEAKIQAELSLATKNIARFPVMRLVLLKLMLAWIDLGYKLTYFLTINPFLPDRRQ